MKNYILLMASIFLMLVSDDLFAQEKQAGSPSKSATGESVKAYKCCSRVFVQCDLKGSKLSSKVLSAKPFNGKNVGADLSFEVLDESGKSITSGWKVTRNVDGDYILNSCNLPLGCCSNKYRLRLKAGVSSESYTF